MIIYLHGFRSGPQSHKSQKLREHMEARGIGDRFWCEQLHWGPAEAMAQVGRVIETSEHEPTLVGSSLGGYYATYLAELHGLRAVLVNPSVVSHITLEPYLGEQELLYTGEKFRLTAQHIDELRQMEIADLADPLRYWLMVETGDEVLDYWQAVAKYAGAKQTVLEGGDHSFTRWQDYLDEVLEFAGLGAR